MTEQFSLGQNAPDFELTDVQGRTIHLSDYRQEKHVILVFTRGFL
jgi:peroxiredoxin